MTCGIVYGKLPPEVKKEQAEKFNRGELKYLVTTDAIGMGLNFNINRIIFYSVEKYESTSQQRKLLDKELIK